MTRFPDPPAWGLFAGLVGKGFVFVAILFFLITAIFAIRKRADVSSKTFVVGVASVLGAFATHVLVLMTRQYEYSYVWENTSDAMAEVYRFSAAWAAQEGSFLLWTLTSAVFAAIVARKTGSYRATFTTICSIALIAMVGILAYESPFQLIQLSPEDRQLLAPGQAMIMPPDGRGLNPTLMNYWMVIHPWVIFIGFGSLLSLFAFAASASLTKDHTSWIDKVRPFTIFSMIVLGVGLTMGGLWAYETLGWGGFWAWDPVENVSLVPFIATAVMVHGLFVQKNRKRWHRLNILLGLMPFVWFVYGTYLTRSGALTAVSVHSFAEMNAGAHGVLLGLVIATVLATIYFVVRAFRQRDDVGEPKISGHRTLGMSIGLSLLYGIGVMAAYGMSLPFFGAMLGRQKEVVAEGDYNFVVAFPFVPVLLLMAFVPFLGWTRTAPERIKTIGNVFFAAVLVFGIATLVLVKSGLTLDGFERMPSKQLIVFYALVFVCLFAIIANAFRTIERMRTRSSGIGAFVTHMGVSLLLLGLIVSRAFEKTDFDGVTLTQPGRLALLPDRTYLASIESLPAPEQLSDPNNRLEFLVRNIATSSEITFRPNFYYEMQGGKPMPISRPDIVRTPLYDLYFVVGAPETELESGITLNEGEEKTVGQFKIRYLERTRVGEAGQVGTRFG
ncbi:MAG: cytochrome c biogenesis protein CcsA, partial [Armatimonadota bacterium]|nr:cytochrome c biogenesis protein CcsA [Armatimonadota bacterium]